MEAGKEQPQRASERPDGRKRVVGKLEQGKSTPMSTEQTALGGW
jgi:hypothetical protein